MVSVKVCGELVVLVFWPANVRFTVDSRTEVAGTTSEAVTVRVELPLWAITVIGYVPGKVLDAEFTESENVPVNGTDAVDKAPLNP